MYMRSALAAMAMGLCLGFAGPQPSSAEEQLRFAGGTDSALPQLLAEVKKETQPTKTTPATTAPVPGKGQPTKVVLKRPSAAEIAADLRAQCRGKKPGSVVMARNDQRWTCFARQMVKPKMKKQATTEPVSRASSKKLVIGPSENGTIKRPASAPTATTSTAPLKHPGTAPSATAQPKQ